METKHTPGPWTVGSGGGCARNHAICEGAAIIAKVMGGGYPVGEGWAPHTEATARLIAAAPDMLAALKIATATISQHINPMKLQTANGERELFNDRCKIIAAAIAKAEGRS